MATNWVSKRRNHKQDRSDTLYVIRHGCASQFGVGAVLILGKIFAVEILISQLLEGCAYQ